MPVIQLKRSLTTAVPPSLANGEPAYTANGNVLFIGSNGAVVPIGGIRTPGVLTSNQALVADASGFLDRILLGNTTVNVTSNSTVIRLANSTTNTQISLPNTVQWSGQWFLHANGSWVQVTTSNPGGANTQVQFNDSGSLNGSAGFTFDKSSNNMTVGNTLSIALGLIVGNSTVNVFSNSSLVVVRDASSSANQTSTGFFTGTSVVNTTTIASGANVLLTTTDLRVGNSTVNTFANSTVMIVRDASSSATQNSTGFFTGTSVVNTSTLAAGANVLVTTTDLRVGNSTVNTFANSILFRVANSTNSANLTPAGLVVGSSVVNGTQVTIGSSFVNATTLSVVDIIATGNITVSGTVTTIDATNLVVTDPLLMLARNQSNTTTFTDVVDIGYFGTFGNTTQTSYTGLFRDASDSGIYKLFSGQIPLPTTTVDTTNTNFSIATLQAFLRSGALISNTTAVTITANSTVSATITANTLTVSNPIVGSSGGTGLNTYTTEDILIANSTNGFRRLSVAGNEGRVLQISSGVVVYADIDGGTY